MNYTSLKISTSGLDRTKDDLLRFTAIEFEVNDDLKPYQAKIINTVDVFIKPEHEFEFNQQLYSFSKEDIDGGYKFTRQVAERLKTYIEGKNITGFNVDNFDLVFLYEYYRRHNIVLDLSKVKTFDTFHIDSILQPRDFISICKRYVGREMDEKDVLNSYEVAKNNMDLFAVQFIQCREQGFLNDIGVPVLSPEHLVAMQNDHLVFCNGKYQYKDVADICDTDPSYIQWIFKVATQITRNTIMEYYYKIHPEKLKK